MKLSTRDMVLSSIFPALMIATAWVNISLFGVSNITIQSLIVITAGLLLGSRLGFISMFTYVILGAIGVPIFAGYSAGLLSLTGGFIISFPIAAYIVGILKEKVFSSDSIVSYIIIGIVGHLVMYAIGFPWFVLIPKYVIDLPQFDWGTAFKWAILVYIPFDLVKVVIASIVANRVNKFYLVNK